MIIFTQFSSGQLRGEPAAVYQWSSPPKSFPSNCALINNTTCAPKLDDSTRGMHKVS